MIRNHFQKSNQSISDKIISLDYLLIFLVLLLGIISFFTMYSTERGVFDYYTKSHIYRFCIFFLVFIAISFINIRFWHQSAYLFYAVILILLFTVEFFGITASGSKRWVNLYFINFALHPFDITFLLSNLLLSDFCQFYLYNLVFGLL